MSNAKQLKIPKLFRKGHKEQPPNDCDEIEEEIRQLQLKLQERQNELFQLQRNSYRRRRSPVKNKTNTETFIRPKEIILENAIRSLKGDIELMSMLTGMEVQSYVANDHCCIVYHMQHDAEHILKHGLTINIKSGENKICKSSFPLGFNLSAVLEDFDNVMMPDCLGAIRKALVAYYSRLEQYDCLKEQNLEVRLFKQLDGSYIIISFEAENEMDEDGPQIQVELRLYYRVYDIRPKTLSFKENVLPEGAVEALQEQCLVFKKKPLHKAFQIAFVDGIGPYKLIQKMKQPITEQFAFRRRHKKRKLHYNNDDTFHPEECSEPSEDEDVDF